MANKSQTGLGYVDASVTLTGSSQQLMAQNLTRGALMIQNVSSANSVGLAFAALTEPGQPAATATASIGASGTFTLAAGNSFAPSGGSIPVNAIFVIGTASQIVTAIQSQP